MKYYVVAIKVTLEREPRDGKRNARPVRLPCSRLFLLPSCRSRDESRDFLPVTPGFWRSDRRCTLFRTSAVSLLLFSSLLCLSNEIPDSRQRFLQGPTSRIRQTPRCCFNSRSDRRGKLVTAGLLDRRLIETVGHGKSGRFEILIYGIG